MLNTNNTSRLRYEVDLMVQHITTELINEFGKSKEEAMRIIKDSDVEDSLSKDKMGFHESPYNWAISILTDQNDYEALEKHFYQ
ncbi:hypothetical protein QTL97_04895 [Sporosarcina thermotolerans]|uniref:Uncharacterized protein n=1 Tax=Sporosarcina thermotolerans TaxID=633404 RepID=A0AAW9A8Q3_9BACL|nr:hypothetical protein [Sporosarcina thermotolerans]MDW0116260.1 hypothetical protein [Sporosarcina thermotolerans]WHT48233.1 hypothetical protein QNH10_19815 [Sporosarcina thermotolerans]